MEIQFRLGVSWGESGGRVPLESWGEIWRRATVGDGGKESTERGGYGLSRRSTYLADCPRWNEVKGKLGNIN